MKKILALLLLLVCSASLQAEYNGYHITISIETIQGHTHTGYVYVASAYLDQDSLQSTRYLTLALDQSWKEYDKRDSLIYYQHRLTYRYTPVWDSAGAEKHAIYYLADRTGIPSAHIKRITITDMIDFGYTMGIANELKLSDTTWMKREPLQRLQYGGYLTYYQIFVHENSAAVTKILKQLDAKMEELKNASVPEEDAEAPEVTGDELDDILWEIIKQLNKRKVVIVVEQSC